MSTSLRIPAILLLSWPFLQSGADPGYELVSRRLPATGGHRTAAGSSMSPMLAGDGRFVVFDSDAPDLVGFDANGPVLDLFRVELATGRTELVSILPDSVLPPNARSYGASVSHDGTAIAFLSEGLATNDIAREAQAFVRHLSAVPGSVPHTDLISERLDGNGPGNAGIRSLVISDDGRRVVFESTATDLASGGDANRTWDIFLRDLESRSTHRLSTSYVAAQAANRESRDPVINRDASVVAFRSEATDLTPAADGNVTDLYLWRAGGDGIQRISLPTLPVAPPVLPVRTMNPILSPDGRYLAFRTATGRIGHPANAVWWYDLAAGTNALASPALTVQLEAGADDASGPVMSGDGRTIAFEALVGDNAEPRIHLWKADTGVHSLDSLRDTVPAGTGEPNRSETPVLSPDGTKLAFLTTDPVPDAGLPGGDYRLIVRTLATGGSYAPPIGPDDFAYDVPLAEFSPDGTKLLFQSEMAIGDQRDENETFDIFLADLENHKLATLSLSEEVVAAKTPSRNSTLSGTCLSADGRFVLFASEAEDIVRGDTNALRDVFRLDRTSGELLLVSRGLAGAGANGASTPLQLSPDGRFALFSSFASNLTAQDTNRLEDIFWADMTAGAIALVSAKDRSDASGATFGASQAKMSDDGTKVAFLSLAKDLVAPMDPYLGVHLFLRVVADRRTHLLSRHPPEGRIRIKMNTMPFDLSADGSRAVFGVTTFGDVTQAGGVLVNDNLAEFPRPLMTNRPVYAVALSPDGERVAFLSQGVTASRRRLGIRDMATGEESEVAAYDSLQGVSDLRFSRDGRSLVFATPAQIPVELTGSDDTNGLPDVFHLDVSSRRLSLLSKPHDGGIGNGAAGLPQISADGSRVAFRSFASNLTEGDYNGFADVFLWERDTRRSTLVSRDPITGLPARGLSTLPLLSADGRFIAFVSSAPDLIQGDFNETMDVFGVMLPPPVFTDSDTDGLPDDWERTVFGDLAQGAAGDFDGDGRSNLDEFVAGTNPASAASLFAVTLSDSTANGVVLRWLSRTGVNYVIETAATPESGAFTAVGALVVGDGLEKSVTLPAGETAGFIRVKVQR